MWYLRRMNSISGTSEEEQHSKEALTKGIYRFIVEEKKLFVEVEEKRMFDTDSIHLHYY